MRAFVSEYGAVDALLSAAVDELPPDEHGIALGCPEHNLFAWTGEQDALSSVAVSVAEVVSLV